MAKKNGFVEGTRVKVGMSDRIMVMCEGHKSGILEGNEIQEERIMLLASTYKADEAGEQK